MKISTNIQNDVCDTLFIPLKMRHDDFRLKRPILNDIAAKEIYNNVDYNFSRYDSKSPMSFIGCLVRAKYMDNQILKFIQQHQNPIVVTAGCGLDTRYQRIGSNNDAIFYDIDMPEVIDLRRQLITENERNVFTSADLTEQTWLTTLSQKHPDGQFILVFEGVMMYLTIEQINTIFDRAIEYFNELTIVADFVNSFAVKNSHRHDMMRHSNAKFVSAVDDPKIICSFHPQLTLVDYKYIMRLMAPYSFLVRLLCLIPTLVKSSFIATYQKTSTY